ncbi:YraN family protein [Paenibacillus nasutitermitis]|uniref:UPF0102 protein GCM10010911_27850 n=1 Tax=Paenibacillus nasutitermitis TaxID=1652958 RepID=A0A917DTW8_9BACL|nr:YraN family protein [Paenibacillus nasutitermitis]GGD68517.1 UPF0102 protein [Paenibacillus nasutitermitis]
MSENDGPVPGPPKRDDRGKTGRQGETAAAEYLLKCGYTILHRNWRCRFGELDIIALQGGELVFVEVRTRKSGGRFGTAAESVDARKQRQVRTIAAFYLQTFRLHGKPVRFDVVAITVDWRSAAVVELKHIEAAF